ncbi:hypothetical protein POSPLADRAFT_1159565 [Postia placenta MAD-698-R-SB12]|uniref:DUF6535 domain-containing protein n=1 Tax=Postia placenta MAD-698-R-SB12 TaxID=670580 RepID=A0A1X6MK43_9APHY|nr:hypothetical protein POSPLADRAFT_1159565 [Postia placenta MAD-698-R-SB12]OSX56715.1 hypothetical protein POSPLADRAFT_1159565 [Postia placenta MAD-698-R-SB12]
MHEVNAKCAREARGTSHEAIYRVGVNTTRRRFGIVALDLRSSITALYKAFSPWLPWNSGGDPAVVVGGSTTDGLLAIDVEQGLPVHDHLAVPQWTSRAGDSYQPSGSTTAAASIVTSNAHDAPGDKTEGDPHDKAEGDPHNRVEGAPRDKVEGDLHDRVEEDLRDRIEEVARDRIEEVVRDGVEEVVRDRVEGDLHNKLDSEQDKSDTKQEDSKFTPAPVSTGLRDLWSICAEKVWHHEENVVRKWKDNISTLLVFVSFIVAFYPMLRPDPQTEVLLIISAQLGAGSYKLTDQQQASLNDAAATGIASSSTKFTSSMWFASMICGISTASVAIAVGQWLHHHLDRPSVMSQKSVQTWWYRHQALKKWQVHLIIDALSFMLQLSMVLFIVGLLRQLWTLNLTVAAVSTTMFVLFVAPTIISVFVPAFAPDCPYKSRTAWLIFWIFRSIWQAQWYVKARKVANWREFEDYSMRTVTPTEGSQKDIMILAAADEVIMDEELLTAVVQPWIQQNRFDTTFPVLCRILEHRAHEIDPRPDAPWPQLKWTSVRQDSAAIIAMAMLCVHLLSNKKDFPSGDAKVSRIMDHLLHLVHVMPLTDAAIEVCEQATNVLSRIPQSWGYGIQQKQLIPVLIELAPDADGCFLEYVVPTWIEKIDPKEVATALTIVQLLRDNKHLKEGHADHAMAKIILTLSAKAEHGPVQLLLLDELRVSLKGMPMRKQPDAYCALIKTIIVGGALLKEEREKRIDIAYTFKYKFPVGVDDVKALLLLLSPDSELKVTDMLKLSSTAFNLARGLSPSEAVDVVPAVYAAITAVSEYLGLPDTHFTQRKLQESNAVILFDSLFRAIDGLFRTHSRLVNQEVVDSFATLSGVPGSELFLQQSDKERCSAKTSAIKRLENMRERLAQNHNCPAYQTSIGEPTIAERYPEGDVWRSSVANARGYALLGFEVSKGRRAFLVTSDAMRGEITGSTPHKEAPEQHKRSKK